MAEPSRNQVLGRRFELQKKLGEGGMGTVYEAYDREAQALVAIKTFKTFSGDDVYGLKREFRLLADIHHENLVRLGELHSDGDRWFFTMELVRGQDILSYVYPGLAEVRSDSGVQERREPDAATLDLETAVREQRIRGLSLDEMRMRSALRQLADAVSALHRAGRVHRDIKPSNVLVDTSGRVVLLDFGVGAELGGAQPTWTRAVGTLAYMAPEQARSERVTSATDWYALGVLMFEMLTTHLPFAGEPSQVLAAKALGPPVVSDLTVPSDLLTLSLALMHPDPSERPRGPEILTAFGSLPALTGTRDLPFVGRRVELDTLLDWLSQGESGLAMLIEGEPGIGKTALRERALQLHVARYPATRVLSGSCYDQESVPYKAWDGLVDALSEYLLLLSAEHLQAVLPVDLYALGSVFPVLRRVPQVEQQCRPETRARWAQDVVQRATEALCALVVRLRRLAPIVLTVDDVQWADDVSLTLFAEVLAAEAEHPIALVATTRARETHFERVLVDRVRKLELGPLSPGHAVELATDMLGGVDAGDKQALCEESNGHPLHLLELCIYASQHGARPGIRLEDSLRARIRALDLRAAHLLALVSVDGPPVPLRALAVAVRTNQAECQLLVQALCAQHLLRAESTHTRRAFGVYHDRVREACLTELAALEGTLTIPDLRWDLASALAETNAPAEREVELPRIARGLCLGAATRTQREIGFAIEVTLEAIASLRRAGAVGAARDHGERALRLLGDAPFASDPERARRLSLELMEVCGLTHDHASCESYYRALLLHAKSAIERSDIHTRRVWLDIHATAYSVAITRARTALEELAVELPLHPHGGHVVSALLRLAKHYPALSAARIASMPECTDPRIRKSLDLLTALAPPAFSSGENAIGALAVLKLAELSFEHGVTSASAYGLAGVGMVVNGALSARRLALRCGEAALLLRGRLYDPLVGSYVDMLCGSFIVPWVRPLDEARALLERSLAESQQVGDLVHLGFVASNLSLNLVLSGHTFAHAEQRHEELIAQLSSAGNLGMATVRCALRMLRFLQRSDDSAELSTFLNDADVALARELPDAPAPVRYYHEVTKGMAACFVHEFAQASLCFAKAEKFADGSFALPLWPEHVFFRAMSELRLAQSQGRVSLRVRARASRAERLLERSSLRCAETFAPRLWILRAERLLADRKVELARSAFAQASGLAQAHGNLVLHALAEERRAACAHAHDQAIAQWKEVGGLRIAAVLDRRRRV